MEDDEVLSEIRELLVEAFNNGEHTADEIEDLTHFLYLGLWERFKDYD